MSFPEHSKVNFVALLHALSGAAALIASVYTATGFLVSVKLIKPLGFALFGAGMLLFAVAMFYLKHASLGEVEPVTDRLVTRGPYRFVRHPLYLGMFVATLGLGLAFGSPWGLLISLAVFIPAGVYRARLEERALARRFGLEWERYVTRTPFIFPF